MGSRALRIARPLCATLALLGAGPSSAVEVTAADYHADALSVVPLIQASCA